MQKRFIQWMSLGLLVGMLAVGSQLVAQPSPGGGGPGGPGSGGGGGGGVDDLGGVPFDGGLSLILLAAGAGYGAKKSKENTAVVAEVV